MCCIIQGDSAHVPLRLSIMWLAANQSVCFGPALLCCIHTRGWEIPTAVVFVVSLLWIHHMMFYLTQRLHMRAGWFHFTRRTPPHAVLLKKPASEPGVSSHIQHTALQWGKKHQSFCCRCSDISIQIDKCHSISFPSQDKCSDACKVLQRVFESVMWKDTRKVFSFVCLWCRK